MTGKLFILAEPRSGSSWLMDTLKSHEEITMRSELYNSSMCSEVNDFHGSGQENFSACIDYLEKKLAPLASPKKRYTGCKILLYQMMLISRDFPAYFIENYKDAHFIFLCRENVVQSHISLRVAHTHNIWHCKTQEDIKKRKVHIYPHEFYSKLERAREVRSKYLELLKKFKVKKIRLTYEKLFVDKARAIAGVCRFLKIPKGDIQFSSEKKGNPFPAEEIIENFKEVKSYLQEFPRYHKMLVKASKEK